MNDSLSDLPEGEIHLWVASPEDWAAPSQIASARHTLDGTEIARLERFRFPAHRHLFLVSHLLVRTALSRYADLPPDAWRFIHDRFGKPHIDPAMGAAPLTFSLAHTASLAVVGVARQHRIGVDVEKADRPVNGAALSRRFFSRVEADALEDLPPGRRAKRFPLYWTLKEAYIKALGPGLSHPLDSSAFHLTGTDPYRIDFSTTDRQDHGTWRFALIEPRPSYVAALCAHAAGHETFAVRCHQALATGESA
ncbi:MAG: 4'-phosphopantetheinyl transferase superfamily protein, partial [Thermodesulfobacteriota bacterium]